MKKTMIALAAFGALASTAHAQSSVTLYGLVDLYIGEATVKTGGVTVAKPGTSLESGGLSGSRWGLRGSEDLGGGLKANFQLEAGISADTGVSAAGFNRTSKLGLSGGFGSIDFGRQYTRLFSLIDSYDAQGTSTFSTANAHFVGAMGDAVRWSNSVVYSTPAMGGFNASAQYAFGENGTPAASAGRSIGVAAGYDAGPFSIQAVYQAEKAIGGAATVKATAVGASYDFKVAKVLGQFINQKNGVVNGVTENFYNLSVAVPVSTAGVINVGFGNERQKTAGIRTLKTSAAAIEYRHSLSKRTTAYAALTNLKSTVTATGVATKGQGYGIGLRHSF